MFKKKVYYSIIYLLFFIIASALLYLLINEKKQLHLDNEKQLINVNYNTIIDAFKTNSNIIYTNQVNTNKIKKMLKNVNDVSLDEKDIIRKKLYKELKMMYQNMHTFGLKQLHFHLKNNDSFLRFHRPNKFGDNLTEIRPTISYVNTNKKFVYGFEEGRIYNGYRFVYPLEYEDKHLGSVEISVSMQKIIDTFRKDLTHNIDFLIKKDIVDQKVFKKEKGKNYKSCHTLNNYYHEKSISKSGNKIIENLITNYDNNDILSKNIQKGLFFNFFSKEKGNYYILSFFPIKNKITNEHISYLIIANKSNTLQEYLYYYFSFYFVILLFLALTIYMLYKTDKIKTLLIHKDKKLREQKREFESLFKNNKDGLAIIDLNSKFLDCNEAYLKMTGFTKKELLKKTSIGLSLPENIEKSKKLLLDIIEKGYIENYEKECIVKDGKRIHTNMSITLLPDKKRLLLSIKDTTLIKLSQSQSKLASMGEMIGNIAHQWRQPLNVISTSISGLRMQNECDIKVTEKDIKETASVIIEQTKYLSNTIDDFRNFIKNEKEYTQTSLKDTILETISLITPTIENNYIKLQTNINDDYMIHGNKNELKQAFINILNNSKDAIVENIKNDHEKVISIQTTILDNNRYEIKFCDNGGGLPNEIINKVFEPYFTTKHQSQGTGLGLSMVNTILMKRHNASVTIYNDTITYNNRKFTGACTQIVFDNKN